jgi:UDP-N-acetylmuramoyl-L-alanyl-D-glutamate--2,6-diaminopimelate ligase
MMDAKKLLSAISYIEQHGSVESPQVNSIVFDSRKVTANDIFVATHGTQVDGHQYIDKAIDLGAKIIICEELPATLNPEIAYYRVKSSQESLGILASTFYDFPTQKLKVIGVTGTNGKTSTTSMLYQLFTNLGYKVGLLSTIDIKIAGEVTTATHTTPDAISIQANMARMVNAGCTYCFMEVSSHAIDQQRIAGIQFCGAVFTNITHDHLDYHKTFANYIQAKKKFFDDLTPSSFALVNLDDKNGKIMIQNTKARTKTFSMRSASDYQVRIIDMSKSDMTIKIDQHELILKIVGEFNAYNALSAYAVAVELGMPREEILIQLSKIAPVEGRMDIIVSAKGNVTGVIDYAHTPDAVEKALVEIGKMRKIGKIITVIGCGGNRDQTKRPIMAQLATKFSDQVILTSDNPRNEDPKAIIQEMKSGLLPDESKKSITVVDRREAINTACMLAEPNDIIALIGKGHEKYQEINGEKLPFDDKAELQNAMNIHIHEN